MPDDSSRPLNKYTIPPSSTTGVLLPGNGRRLIGIMNASATDQAYALVVYDAPGVGIASQVGQTQYPPIYRAQLGPGRLIDMTLLNRVPKFDYGIVCIPAGAANNDGGWTIIYE